MPVKNPKCLVIDASVVRAAGGIDAIDPIPVRCRDFLKEVLSLGHTVIVTDDIEIEWQKHQSEFARDWYFRMRKRGQINRRRGVTRDDDLRELIFAVIDPQARANVEKDMRLLEAARLADKRVASKDDTMRGHFQRAAYKVDELKLIIWINPVEEADGCVLWLREGALEEIHRTLGYLPPIAP
jgi:hypothetical protein